ncbi:MAG: hypothetical protein IJC86_05605 [Clostridia bacterium]|nr:hypothetical protein [Clostridia bacterium]
MARVGIVLSGGLAKGAYQMGALKCISEFFSPEELICMSASSVGILNAYAYATNKMELGEKLWSDLEVKGMISSYRKLALTSFVYDTVDALIDESDVIPLNLYTTCYNISDSEVKYINLRKRPKEDHNILMRASVCFPLFAKPLVINGKKYIDGALIDNIPVTPMHKHDLDYIIVVHFDKKSYVFENEHFDRRIIQINYYDDTLVKNFLALDKASISNMTQVGYEKCHAILSKLFRNGTDDLETIYEGIDELNKEHTTSERRITGDVVLRNINKFTQKFLSKEEIG